MTRRIALLAAVAAVATGCVTAKQKDYAKFVAAQPRSILVVPVMNKSVSLTASDYFLSTIPIPLAERGYYVFPVNLVKRLLEDEGLADPGLVHSADTTRLASMFGADAVQDGKTGDTLWEDAQTMVYASGDGGGGLLGAIVSAAITKAAPDYMPLARQANANAMRYPGPGFPAGPYRPDYGKDYVVPAAAVEPAPAPAPAAR
jgi:hypothetical protein